LKKLGQSVYLNIVEVLLDVVLEARRRATRVFKVALLEATAVPIVPAVPDVIFT